MKRRFSASLIIGCFVAGTGVCVLPSAQAKGPGNARGLGASTNNGFSGSGASQSAPANSRPAWSGSEHGRSSGANLPNTANGNSNHLDNHAISQQQINQARIYEHRLEQAEHLRLNAARNGNAHLLDTAARMESQATDQFNRRTEQINLIAPPQNQTAAQPMVQSTPRPISARPPQAAASGMPAQKPAPTQSRRWRWWPFNR